MKNTCLCLCILGDKEKPFCRGYAVNNEHYSQRYRWSLDSAMVFLGMCTHQPRRYVITYRRLRMICCCWSRSKSFIGDPWHSFNANSLILLKFNILPAVYVRYGRLVCSSTASGSCVDIYPIEVWMFAFLWFDAVNDCLTDNRSAGTSIMAVDTIQRTFCSRVDLSLKTLTVTRTIFGRSKQNFMFAPVTEVVKILVWHEFLKW